MSNETVSLETIHKSFCHFLDSCGKFSFYTRSTQVQREKVIDCDQYLTAIKQYKYQAVKRDNEHDANQFFHMQCMINALRSSLLMWIHLKEGNFEDAWSHLVDAQEYTSIALRVKDYDGVRDLEARLKCAEGSIFPDWKQYLSPGFVETIGKCSICHDSFSTCDHIENEIYMGSLCQRLDREIVRFDHSALVENPRDRRCVITRTSDDEGNEIDWFTLEKTGKRTDPDKGFHISGRLYCMVSLDLH